MDNMPAMEPYKVLIRADGQHRIVEINSSAFVADATGWIEIDQGYGDKYHHAQGNYFTEPICDERGVKRYAYVPDAAEGHPKWRERTQAEIDADYVPPAAAPDPVLDLAGMVIDLTIEVEELKLQQTEGGEAGV